ncbi:hypothetical protein ACPF8X_42615, partial [Streptomyces sp. G35A]
WGNKQQAPVDPDPYIPVAMFSNNNPPLDVVEKFKVLATKLSELKMTVRVAGGNSEADNAAKELAGEKVEEYLPFKGYEGRESPQNQWSDEASIEQACKFHPAADKMKDGAKKFLSRNLRMMQGKSLKSPVKFLIIWSEDGASTLAEKTFKTGAAGHFLSIAAGTKTPVFNLAKQGTYEKLMEFLEPEKEPEFKRPVQEGHDRPQYPQRNNNYQNNNHKKPQYREPENNDGYPQSNDSDGDIDYDDY